jgi:predicted amidohydrolase
MRVAVIQMRAGEDRADNLRKALEFLSAGRKKNARLLVLPEIFSYRGRVPGVPDRRDMFEPVPGPSTKPLMAFAEKHRVFVAGGSVYERAAKGGRGYNTTLLIGPRGTVLAKYRKIHLFEATVSGQRYRETDVFLPGKKNGHRPDRRISGGT